MDPNSDEAKDHANFALRAFESAANSPKALTVTRVVKASQQVNISNFVLINLNDIVLYNCM